MDDIVDDIRDEASSHSYLVLFPGDTLPLRIQKHMNESLYEHLRGKLVSDSLRIIGIVTRWPKKTAVEGGDFSLIQDTGNQSQTLMLGSYGIPSVGITVEVVSWSVEGDDEIVIMGKGRQRFSISDMSSRNRVVFGNVSILDDDDAMPAPYLENSSLLGGRFHRRDGMGDPAMSAALNPFPQWVLDAKCPQHLAAQAYERYMSSLEWQGDDIRDDADEQDEDDDESYGDGDDGYNGDSDDAGDVHESVAVMADTLDTYSDNSGDNSSYADSSSEEDSASGSDGYYSAHESPSESAAVGVAMVGTPVSIVGSVAASGDAGEAAVSSEPSSSRRSGEALASVRALVDLMLSANTTDALRGIQHRRLMAGSDVEDTEPASSRGPSTAGGVGNVQIKWGCADMDTDAEAECSTKGHRKHWNAVQHPVRFSYYLASNLPLSDEEKLGLLAFPTVELRLRKLIEYMRADMDSVLACCHCAGTIAHRSDIFSVPGADGTVGAYVNPHGVVHQTITIKQLASRSCYILEGQHATTQDTWFPGYGWIIAYCSRCYNHLGWRFVSVGSNGSSSVACFWGIRRGAVVVQRRQV